ncbi:MAG: hypothetical protein JWM95_803 [Gemmatimonadetes bacterium]|nr:hypothetical protein [Gemmatimonadota bacterium]
MRLLRISAMAVGLAALVSQSGAAQEGRQFKDAWFWGAKAGMLSYASATTTNGGAPLVGGEWLITRTNGGLYVSYDQAFFNTFGGFVDRDPDSVFVRNVKIKNMRRFTMAGMAFPWQSNKLHPYVGLGLSFNQIAGTSLVGSFVNSTRQAIAVDSVQSKKTGVSPIFIAGVQARYNPASLFIQSTVSPIQSSFFLANPTSSQSFNFSLEVGVRYNVGSSIDRAR